jgi:hypothetical protein
MEHNLGPQEKRILAFLSKGNFRDGMEFFYRTYATGSEKIPDRAFLLTVLSELNRIFAFAEGLKAYKQVGRWYPSDPEFVRNEKLLKRNYYHRLIEDGNKIILAAAERSQRFQAESGTLDKLYREKLLVENQNALKKMYEEASGIYVSALEFKPNGHEALYGLVKCYRELGDTDKEKRIQAKIDDLLKDEVAEEIPVTPVEHADSETPEEQIDEPKPQHFDIKPLERLYEEKKFEQVLEALENILSRNDRFVPALVLKAKVLVERHQFHPAEKCITRALQNAPGEQWIHDYHLDFLDNKFRVLAHGAAQYLKKGIELGPMLGREHFNKAVYCLKQALLIAIGDTDLMDQLYTAYSYLGETEAAFQVKKELLLGQPQFEMSYDRMKASAFCFIAGYAYGDDPCRVNQFREIRRQCLLPFRWGRRIVSLYVRQSPDLIRLARRWGIPPVCFRLILEPVRRIWLFCRKGVMHSWNP